MRALQFHAPTIPFGACAVSFDLSLRLTVRLSCRDAGAAIHWRVSDAAETDYEVMDMRLKITTNNVAKPRIVYNRGAVLLTYRLVLILAIVYHPCSQPVDDILA